MRYFINEAKGELENDADPAKLKNYSNKNYATYVLYYCIYTTVLYVRLAKEDQLPEAGGPASSDTGGT